MDHLTEVLTIREVAARWRKHPTSVRRAIDARRTPLMARKSPDDDHGVWLIARESVIARWGLPTA